MPEEKWLLSVLVKYYRSRRAADREQVEVLRRGPDGYWKLYAAGIPAAFAPNVVDELIRRGWVIVEGKE